MIEVRIDGGTSKAKRVARHLGIKGVKKCKLLPKGFTRMSNFKALEPNRHSVCFAPCTEENHRKVRKAYVKTNTPLFHFIDKCPR